MSDYSDIIDHEHYQSKTRPHMSMLNRAAQFSPFAALVGFEQYIDDATEEMSIDQIETEDIEIL
ncbi:MAG: hypothetical protein ILN61_06020 [Lachnospiraceae bacterium]|nr:hypothetical protein [Lachnospiraceae bacterium]MBP5414781.1 hypothetical protein [Lachnospiraceae bacterium]